MGMNNWGCEVLLLSTGLAGAHTLGLNDLIWIGLLQMLGRVMTAQVQ